MNLINLDQDVLQTLDFFSENTPPLLDVSTYSFPFVVGSGNAYHTGAILFSGRSAIFADESNFRTLVDAYAPAIKQGLISEAVIISASGEKDSVWELEVAKKHGLSTTLLTCKPNSSATKIADETLAYRTIDEPYTYNVSSYLGMILSATNEDPKDIKSFIESLTLPENFGKYDAYAFVVPDEFINICPMLDIKKSELFGPFVSLRAFSEGHARHAKFVIPTEKELVIGVGIRNEHFGHPDHRFDIPLPENAGYGLVMALTYFLTGKIQASKPPYFKDNIIPFTQDYGPKAYGKKEVFEVIVPGN